MTLDQLIQTRLAELEIKRSELARGMGYAQDKLGKGCTRIDRIREGDLRLAWNLRERLAQGLQVTTEVVEAAIAATFDAQEAAWRAAFKPHGVVRTTNRGRPTCSLTIFALSGQAEKLTLHFEEGSDPETFVEQALPQLPDRVLGLGETTGFVVNYTPDEAILYDKQGRQIEKLAEVAQAPSSEIIIGSKRVSSRTLSGLFRGVEVKES